MRKAEINTILVVILTVIAFVLSVLILTKIWEAASAKGRLDCKVGYMISGMVSWAIRPTDAATKAIAEATKIIGTAAAATTAIIGASMAVMALSKTSTGKRIISKVDDFLKQHKNLQKIATYAGKGIKYAARKKGLLIGLGVTAGIAPYAASWLEAASQALSDLAMSLSGAALTICKPHTAIMTGNISEFKNFATDACKEIIKEINMTYLNNINITDCRELDDAKIERLHKIYLTYILSKLAAYTFGESLGAMITGTPVVHYMYYVENVSQNIWSVTELDILCMLKAIEYSKDMSYYDWIYGDSKEYVENMRNLDHKICDLLGIKIDYIATDSKDKGKDYFTIAVIDENTNCKEKDTEPYFECIGYLIANSNPTDYLILIKNTGTGSILILSNAV